MTPPKVVWSVCIIRCPLYDFCMVLVSLLFRLSDVKWSHYVFLHLHFDFSVFISKLNNERLF